MNQRNWPVYNAAHNAIRPGLRQRRRQDARRGMSLILALFVLAVTSMLLIGILGSETVRLSAVRNSGESDRARFLAGAAVHHVLAEIEADNAWIDDPGEISSTEFPAGSGNYYNATIVAAEGDTYLITGQGITSEITRTLEVTIQLD